jgi:hypothetical protein
LASCQHDLVCIVITRHKLRSIAPSHPRFCTSRLGLAPAFLPVTNGFLLLEQSLPQRMYNLQPGSSSHRWISRFGNNACRIDNPNQQKTCLIE